MVNPQLLWMRAFYSYYNPLMAVRVLAKIRLKMRGATLVMAGQDDGLEASVRQLAKKLGVDESIRFPGFLDQQGKLREGDTADIFLNTNSVDNMPVSILEACAMGLPVVSTNVGGIPDLLTHGETGLLVPDNDSEAMTEAVCRLIQEPELSGRLSANGRRLAERCSWHQVYPAWNRLFHEIVER
jgi:glycosyltransferase involved in cell wall biosynthesis